MNNSRGRKSLLDNKQIKDIIDDYVIANGVSTKIKYADMYKYSLELFNSNKIQVLPSESFWRKKDRAGRIAIDELNRSLFQRNETNNSKSDFFTLLQLIESKVDNSQIKTVILNELKSYQQKIYNKEKEISQQKTTIDRLNKKINQLIDLNTQQQEFIFQMMYYFLKNSSKENEDFFNSAFNQIFSNPTDFINNFETKKPNRNDDLIDLFKSRLT